MFNVHILAQQNLHFIGRCHTDIDDWHQHHASRYLKKVNKCQMPVLDVCVIAAINWPRRQRPIDKPPVRLRMFTALHSKTGAIGSYMVGFGTCRKFSALCLEFGSILYSISLEKAVMSDLSKFRIGFSLNQHFVKEYHECLEFHVGYFFLSLSDWNGRGLGLRMQQISLVPPILSLPSPPLCRSFKKKRSRVTCLSF